MEHFLSRDILVKIAEYLNDVKDYLHLFQINKHIYENILNNKDFILDNHLFTFDRETKLIEKLPNYLFNLKYLNINNENNDFNLLLKFKFIKYLQINKLPEKFIFTEFPFLEELVIFNSILQKETFKNLTHVKKCYFTSCKIKDSYLDHLINLEELTFNNCKEITGECLQHFDKLTSLTDISSFLDDDVAEYIEGLTKLKHLKIFTYSLSFNSYFLRNLINLETLDITLQDFDKEDLNLLINLKELSISGLDLNLSDDENNNCFNNLINLVKLNVNCLTTFTGKCLLNLTNLVKLFIEGTPVKDQYLINLKNLKELNINYCKNIEGTCLQNMIGLQVLEASNTNLEDNYLKQLRSLISLDLYVSVCKHITGECLLKLTNLEELIINNNENINENYFFNLTNLKTLEISKCKNITGKCFANLINLIDLFINGNCVNEDYLEKLTNLQTLHAFNCPSIKKGQFLLKMNKLNTFRTTNGYSEIEELRERVKAGQTIEETRKHKQFHHFNTPIKQ
ncbi:hypothetical protein ABK040_005281 [Willaertia magna]